MKITYILLFEGENYLSSPRLTKKRWTQSVPGFQVLKNSLLYRSLSCPLGTTKLLSPTLRGQDVRDGNPPPGGVPGIQKLLGRLLFPAALELAVFVPPSPGLRSVLILCEMISLWPKSCFSVKEFCYFLFLIPKAASFLRCLLSPPGTTEPVKMSPRFKFSKKRNGESTFKSS